MPAKSRKAQGMSLNVIVIAAIVLVVLAVLLGITTGYFGKWTGKFRIASDTCQSAGGKVSEECSSGLEESALSYPDVLEGMKCCVEKKLCSDLGGECEDVCSSSKRLTGGDWSCDGLSPPRPNCCKTI